MLRRKTIQLKRYNKNVKQVKKSSCKNVIAIYITYQSKMLKQYQNLIYTYFYIK